MDGSGFAGNRPRWEWYELVFRYRRRISRLGAVYGLSDVDSASAAADVALCLCLDLRINDPQQAERRFWRRLRYDLRHFHHHHGSTREIPFSSLTAIGRAAEEFPTDRIIDRVSAGHTKANQIEHTYLCQVFREIDRLPSRQRGIMLSLAGGSTPIEIAEQLDVEVESVLSDMGVARAWLISADEPTS